jgi:B-box zinc finger
MTDQSQSVADSVGTALPPADRCANHRDRETRVHCSNCGKPICPDCMVYSPVGIKCQECAKLPRSALVTLKPDRAARAVGAALLIGTAAGFGYYLLLGFFGFFLFFIAAGIGYVVGEGVIRASGFYRGKTTALIAVGGTVWAFAFPPLVFSIAAAGLRWQTVLFSLTGRGLMTWFVVLIAGFVAWRRAR